MGHRPYVIGGALVLASYIWSGLCGTERSIPAELMVLRRGEQLDRLKAILMRRIPVIASRT
jgi:hypothetical protein